jgi:2-keto-4-pentenoate hydratase/2-oxohepta-3-ene-1,7-dioic acid hydratase in catechol pathway
LKLVSYSQHGQTRLGAVQRGKIIDLAGAAHRFAAATNREVPHARFAAMADLLSSPKETIRTANEIVAWAQKNAPEEMINLDTAEIEVPLSNPSKIICIGLNYADHCRETGIPIPESPVLFCKFITSLLPHGGQITWSRAMTQQVDYEAELALIIGKKAFNVSEEAALEHVGGYTILNDVSARDVQFSDGQWVRGKSFDTFCPIGPFVVTADALPNPHALDIQSRVNGAIMQNSNTAEMIFKIPYLISYISRSITLMPGDIISTGTPHGVGIGQDPQVFLKAGDTVEVEVEGIGILINTVH